MCHPLRRPAACRSACKNRCHWLAAFSAVERCCAARIRPTRVHDPLRAKIVRPLSRPAEVQVAARNGYPSRSAQSWSDAAIRPGAGRRMGHHNCHYRRWRVRKQVNHGGPKVHGGHDQVQGHCDRRPDGLWASVSAGAGGFAGLAVALCGHSETALSWGCLGCLHRECFGRPRQAGATGPP